jgi:hypothetical protein
MSLQNMSLQVASHAKPLGTAANCARKRLLVSVGPDMIMEMVPSRKRGVLTTRKFANQLSVHSL